MLQQHLVILMVKLAVAASLASVLTRSARFTSMLMREERTLMHRVQMALVSAAIAANNWNWRSRPSARKAAVC